MGGSFSAEHGIGQSKLDLMRLQKQPSQLAALQAIKHALDPKSIMNPGKLVPMEPVPPAYEKDRKMSASDTAICGCCSADILARFVEFGKTG